MIQEIAYGDGRAWHSTATGRTFPFTNPSADEGRHREQMRRLAAKAEQESHPKSTREAGAGVPSPHRKGHG